MQVFFLYYFQSILLFINTLIASAYIELTLKRLIGQLFDEKITQFLC